MGFWESIVGVLLTAKGIVLAAVGFGLMVVAHEFGHFLAAKLVGVRVERFSVGFGWKLWSRTWGETEYVLAALPVGGYVKMAGGDEGEEATGAPDEFISKTPGQRAVVLVAGPVFSILFGIPLAIAMFLVGREVPQAKVSHVVVESAAWKAGLKQGDTIVRVEGREVGNFDELREAVFKSSAEIAIPVVVEREGKTLDLTATLALQHGLGVQCQALTLELKEVTPESPAEQAGLQPGDVMVSANGTRLRSWQQFRSKILASPGQTMRLVVRRDGVDRMIEATPRVIKRGDPGFTIHLPNEVGYVREGFPAEGKLRVGDRIVAVNGRRVYRWWPIEEAVPLEAATVTFTVARDGGRREVEVNLEAGTWLADRAGIAPVAAFIVDTVHGEAEPPLRPGDRILEAGRGDVATAIRTDLLYRPLLDVLDWMSRAKTLRVQRGSEEPFEVALTPGTRRAGRLGVGPVSMVVFHQEGLGGAIAHAPKKTLDAGLLVYVVLRKLMTGGAKGSDIAGPLGIFQIMYASARRGWGYFFWLVHLLTVNIGLLNLLPIPPLDGGRLLMVGYEKVRGRRMSQKVQEAILIAGVVLVVMIFAFATFNDVRRIFF